MKHVRAWATRIGEAPRGAARDEDPSLIDGPAPARLRSPLIDGPAPARLEPTPEPGLLAGAASSYSPGVMSAPAASFSPPRGSCSGGARRPPRRRRRRTAAAAGRRGRPSTAADSAPLPFPRPPPAPAPVPAPVPAAAATAPQGPDVHGQRLHRDGIYLLDREALQRRRRYRGFDNRHNTFTLQNAVVDASASIIGLSARVALQVGHTRPPITNAGSEPNLPAGRCRPVHPPIPGASSRQAYAGYNANVARGPGDRGGHLPLAHRPRVHGRQGRLELLALQPLLRPPLLPHRPPRNPPGDRARLLRLLAG